jgi:error-prone DNA polymerase
MKGNMIAPYLDGRHGFAKAEYIHPDLEPILRETFGVVIFHEHVLRIFDKLTGCGLAKADEFRRSLEDPRASDSVEQFFRAEAAKRGYSPLVIQKVWEILKSFSSFGFCKAHGAAFALPTYQSAWLKTHHPKEFLAGLFTHDPGMYPRRLLLAEARRLGVKLLPIDVNVSTHEFLVEPEGIRMSLSDIAGMSEVELARIIENRPYGDVADFYLRARPSRRTLERLASIGALDSLINGTEYNRGDILARVRELNAITKRPNVDPNQPMLDFDLLERLPQGNTAPTKAEIVAAEMAILKMDVTEHAIEQYRPMLDEMGVVHSNELVGLRNKSEVLVAGIRVATQTPPMRSGKRVVFITLDDGFGCSDSTFFDEAQSRSSHILFNNRLLVISGKTRRTGVNGVSIMAENAWDIREL